MKSTACFLTVCLVGSVLPLMVQGAENLESHPPGNGPKAQARRILPVIIEIEPGTIKLLFIRNLGEATIELQLMDGNTAINETMDTSIQTQATFIVPTDTYILTVMAADGTILIEETILIP